MTTASAYAPPSISWRFLPVWRRNFLVWRKLAVPSILGNLADPMIYMLGLGYGLGTLLPQMGGVSYMAFLAGGTVCFSTVNSATFETLYSSFSRMHEQRTWEAIMNAPVALDDVVLAELLWATSKAFLSGFAILVVVWGLGLSTSPLSLWAILAVPVIGFCFAGMGLVITSLAPSYDFFMYYFTLIVTPMAMLCGIFFPLEQLPTGLQTFALLLPLSHATLLVRPLLLGHVPTQPLVHVAVLLLYGAAGFYVAVLLLRRRLLR